MQKTTKKVVVKKVVVKKGQIWDVREASRGQRRLGVVKISRLKQQVLVKNIETGKETEIRLDRFQTNPFVLVQATA